MAGTSYQREWTMSLSLHRAKFALVFLSVALPAMPAAAQVIDILHSFTGGANDGQNPSGALTISGTTLLGMTPEGGSGGDGTIFQMGLDGSGFGTIHNFRGGLTDGDTPLGTLALAGQAVYGMTQGGGSVPYGGTVFQINTAGSGFTIDHAFVGGPNDGFNALGSPDDFRIGRLRHDFPGRHRQSWHDFQAESRWHRVHRDPFLHRRGVRRPSTNVFLAGGIRLDHLRNDG